MRKGSALAAALLIGCADPHRLSGPPMMGDLEVTVNVTGDASLISRPTYPLVFDSTYAFALTPGRSSTVQMVEGDHVVKFDGRDPPANTLISGLAATSVEWCTIMNGGRRIVHISVTRSASVEYGIDCAPLEGTGRMNVTFNATGSHIPQAFPLTLTRMQGFYYVTTETLSPGIAGSVSLPVGVYRLSTSTPCTGFGNPILRPFEYSVVRTGADTNISFNLKCT